MYKNRYGSSWFNDDVQLSTIVLQRFDKKYFSMDLLNLESVSVLVHWLNKKSLPQVTELTAESSKLLEMLNQNVLVGVTSLNSKNEMTRN